MARSYISVAIDRAVRQRAREQCEYCRAPEHINTDPFSIEHIHPVSLGGSNDEDNLALSCLGCNLLKGVRIDAIDLATGNRVNLFHPRLDCWREHFGWSDDFEEVEALTAKGRVTILALDLNRFKLCNLRRVLIRSNLHPPTEETTE